jgi:hypothetical protein
MSNIINKEGVFYDLPFSEYKQHPGVNASFIKKFAVSPLYAKTDSFKSSPATDLGNYVHALLIDRSSLENYACLPTTGEGSKTARAKWRSEHPEGILLSPDQMDTGNVTAEALKNNPMFKEFMSMETVATEVSFFYKHPKFGFWMKARIDILAIDKNGDIHIGDVKTYGKPLTKKTLFWDIRDRGYDIQMAAYYRAIQNLMKKSPVSHTFFFVETETDAHDQAAVSIDDGWLAHAEHRLDEYYRIYNECQSEDVWPGFNFGKPLTLSLGDTV